jgi:UDP-N-acetylmuramoylalanine--D-glutamate ligase
LLAGGKDKAMQWDVWAQKVTERVKTVILFGELADLLAEKLSEQNHPAFHKVNTVAEAVELAAGTAVSGDIVLLSPGGTSYDAFQDFEARGRLFRQLVNEL